MKRDISLELLIDYIQNNLSELKKVTGDCNSCCMKKKCDKARHNEIIHGILGTDYRNTRFPLLLSIIQKIPFVLYVIPKVIFRKWSEYDNNPFMLLGCPTVGIVNHIEEIRECYNTLNDERSKQTYIAVLMYRLSYNARYLKQVYSEEAEYFEIFNNLSNEEVFIDCGAYVGDTWREYLEHNDIPQKYICYEPDKNNYDKLKLAVEGNDYVIVKNAGVSDKNGVLNFRNNMQMASSFTDTDDGEQVSVVSIDEDNKELNLPISFIKMDIEGAERQALLGAEKTIKKYLPKMAICIS